VAGLRPGLTGETYSTPPNTQMHLRKKNTEIGKERGWEVEKGKEEKGMGEEGLCSSKEERGREGIICEREKEMARRAGRKEAR